MKRKKGLLFIPLLLGLLGCGQDKMEPLKEIKAEMEEEQENVLGGTKTEGDLTVTINQIVFEENSVILDYTVKSEDLTPYGDVVPKIWKEGKEKNGASGFDLNEKSKREKNYIMFFEGPGLEFFSKDIGTEAEIRFASQTGLSDVDIIFPVKIKKIYDTEVIPIGKKLEYKNEFITVDSIECSRFYTAVYVKYMDNDSMLDFCMPRLTDSKSKEVTFFGGGPERFLYGRLADDCKKVNISMVQYEEIDRCKTISDSLEIELN